MVENQHGLGAILSFSAKSVNPQVLEALLVGREKLVKQLENRVKNITDDGLNHQVMIVGARGTGKTHMLSVLYSRIQPFIKADKIKVAYFAEEEYGISGFLDFLVRVLNAFIRWNENDEKFLKSQLSILQETPAIHQENTIKNIIRDYIGEKPLLILAENFNDIMAFLKKDGQSKLRNWLQENNRISIIATSQALSEDIGKEDKPFYGFFDEINLKPLSLEQSFQLLKSLAKIEKREDIIEHLDNKGKAQVMAINTLVKGNHRLLITFYEFLKSDVLSNLSVLFIKTLNDLKPYYETYIRYQPPQQQKIIRFLALAKTPQHGTDVSRECFIDQKSLSKQLSELSRKKLVDIVTDPNDKRNKLYDISEPLLRISIEIGEQKEGISALFIDFLALYYNHEELLTQKNKFLGFYNKTQDPREKQQFNFELLARDQALKIQESINNKFSKERNLVLEVVKKEFNEGNFEIAIDSLEKEFNKNQEFKKVHESLYYFIKAYSCYKSDNLVKAKKHILKSIELNTTTEISWFFYGDILYEERGFKKAVKAYSKALELNPNESYILKSLAKSYIELKEYDEAIIVLEKAINLDSDNFKLIKLLVRTHNKLKNFKKSIEICENYLKNNNDDIKMLKELSSVYLQDDDLNSAIKYSKRALQIKPDSFYVKCALVYMYEIKEDFNLVLKTAYSLFHVKVLNTLEFEDKESIDYLINVLIFIMKYENKFTQKKHELIQTVITKYLKDIPELQISINLFNVFKEIELNNNMKALYELPKEQRAFFQKEILDFRKNRAISK